MSATISGFVGIVIEPDAATIAKAYALAATLVPAGAEQVLAPGSLPHITLTQCPLREAPAVVAVVVLVQGLVASENLGSR